MSLRPSIMFYPTESYNNRAKAEMRWDDDANIYGDIGPEWQISLGNGKRLNRKWRACGGLTYVYDNNGCERAIYNENYDREWQQAIKELRPPQGLTRQVAMDYDRSFQPDGDPEFYYSEIQHTN